VLALNSVVIGVPRCGTIRLRLMLNAHPAVSLKTGHYKDEH